MCRSPLACALLWLTVTGASGSTGCSGQASPSDAIAPAPSPSPEVGAVTPADFVGTFVGQDVRLILVGPGRLKSGTLVRNETEYTVVAEVDAHRVFGEFTAGDRAFEFRARIESDGAIEFESGGRSVRLMRIDEDNPFSTPTPAVEQSVALDFEVEPTSDPSDQTAEVPTVVAQLTDEIAFEHPAGWQVLDQPGSKVLIPTDAKFAEESPLEVLSVAFFPVPSAQVGPAESRHFADQMASNTGDWLRFHSDRGTASLGGRTWYRFDYAGTTGSLAARYAVWCAEAPGGVLCGLSLTPPADFERRSDQLERMLSTIDVAGGAPPPAVATAPPGKIDPAFVGRWYREDVHVSGGFSMVFVYYRAYYADGTVLQSDRSFAGMEHTDASGNFAGNTSVDGESGVTRGRWHVEDGDLIIEWADGTVGRWDYEVRDAGATIATHAGKWRFWRLNQRW